VQQACVPILQAFVAMAQRVVELAHQRGAQTPWAKTVGTCHKLLPVADGLWTFLKNRGSESINNVAVDGVFSAGVRALCQLVIQGIIRVLPGENRMGWVAWLTLVSMSARLPV
jgi:hypothetical protein